MKARVRDAGKATAVMALTGDFDVYSSPFVKDDLLTLIKRGRMRVVVNLDTVTYIDSTALGVLLDGLRRA